MFNSRLASTDHGVFTSIPEHIVGFDTEKLVCSHHRRDANAQTTSLSRQMKKAIRPPLVCLFVFAHVQQRNTTAETIFPDLDAVYRKETKGLPRDYKDMSIHEPISFGIVPYYGGHLDESGIQSYLAMPS